MPENDQNRKVKKKKEEKEKGNRMTRLSKIWVTKPYLMTKNLTRYSASSGHIIRIKLLIVLFSSYIFPLEHPGLLIVATSYSFCTSNRTELVKITYNKIIPYDKKSNKI